jgi:GNAT superfamily N-acetyltransferase
MRMTIRLRPGKAHDEQTLLRLFDEAVLWLNARGLAGQWGTEPWSERPETKERVARLAASSGLTVAEVNDEVVGALEVSEIAPSYAPMTNEPGLYIVMLLASRRFIGLSIGTALLDHARRDCLDRGLSLLRVDCWAGGAQRLVHYYESAGFRPTATFDRDGWPGQLLIQRLAG